MLRAKFRGNRIDSGDMRNKPSSARAKQDFIGLGDYIRAEVDSIVDEFAEFAQTHIESAKRLPAEELRDTAASLLNNIADDMESSQSDSDRSEKSRGDTPNNSPALVEDAKSHARDRLGSSFSLMEMVSEYRALRANVVRRWRDAAVGDPATAIEDVIRFDEAIDQALMESIQWYASRTDRARELMAGMIAHDLRNPLGAIMMSANYLLRSESIGGPEMKAAARVLGSASAMEKMVADLLDFAQVRMGGHLSISRAKTSMRKTCNDAVGELRAYHPDRAIELNVSDKLEGDWDGDRVRQVISNLVANALKHGAADSPVAVSASEDGLNVRLDVHNLGEPIAADHLKDIFDPLKRFPKNAQNRQSNHGIGLGLSSSRRLPRLTTARWMCRPRERPARLSA